MKNLKRFFQKVSLPVFAVLLMTGEIFAKTDAKAGLEKLGTEANSMSISLAATVINVVGILYIGFMLLGILVSVALERQGHKEVTKDIGVGTGLLVLPSVLSFLINVLGFSDLYSKILF